MSGLFATLQSLAGTLDVYSRALETEGQNVANASAAGYAALRVSIHPVGILQTASFDVIDISSSGDARTDALVRSATSQSSYSQTQASQLAPVSQLFDITGATGILQALQGFSTAFSKASVSPNDSVLRASALSAAGNVAQAFNSAATHVTVIQGQIDTAIKSTVSQVNSLSSQIARYNTQIQGKTDVDPAVDANIRSTLNQLSSLVNVSVSQNVDGTYQVLAGGSLPLVSEDTAFSLGANAGAAAGSQVVSSGGGASPAVFSGSLGALLDLRSNVVGPLLGGSGASGSLNTLAAGFAARVNALTTSGTAPDGTPGTPVFTWDATNPSNIAASLSLDPSATAAGLALASTGPGASANGIANQLAGLASSTDPADQINGQAPQDLFAAIATQIGQATANAQAQSGVDQSSLTSAQVQQQQVEGVSLDQEAVLLTSYQRGYEANAKLVTILDQLTSDEVNIIK